MANDAVEADGDDDEEDTVAVVHKRGRRESGLDSRKHEKGEAVAKRKKKARVLVEVKVYDCIFTFLATDQVFFINEDKTSNQCIDGSCYSIVL